MINDHLVTGLTNNVLVRQKDGKEFEVRLLAHWSDIQAKDGETDSVKWMGGSQYISTKGQVYTLKEDTTP